ncbi:hypothetical protein F2Q69_00048542 [Brassica cretica]|uniref:Uncharacterized protein n=1 Tax=Brassica cretica TaxID=69181 RepID=A0A8S9Q0F1_BRACR|nr:hypothetical protein F2Q69_00048542 [Brassica cretica]
MMLLKLIRRLDEEAVPVAPLRRYHPQGFEGAGPCLEIVEEEVSEIQGKFSLPLEDGQLIDEEPLKGTKYRMPFGNRWNRSYLPTSIIRLGSIGEGRIDHCEEVETCFFLGESGSFVSLSYLGNRVEVPVVDVFEEYQKMMVLRRRSHPCSERGKLQSESLFLQLKVQSLIRHQMLTFQRVRVMALWELIHEWLDKRVEHWKPKEEFHQYQLIMGVDDD